MPARLTNRFTPEQQVEYLKKECFYCGKPGHFSRDCDKRITDITVEVKKLSTSSSLPEDDDSRYATSPDPSNNPASVLLMAIETEGVAALNKIACGLRLIPSHLNTIEDPEASGQPLNTSRNSTYRAQMDAMTSALQEPISKSTFDLRWREYLDAANKASHARKI